MKGKNASSSAGSKLRARAEKFLAAEGADLRRMPAAQVRHLVHELKVYQVELEMQVDKLRRAQAEQECAFQAQLLDAATDSIMVHDVEGNFIYLNEAAYKARGYSQEELMAIKLKDLDTPDYARLIAPRLKECLAKGEIIVESAHYCKDGSIMPVEIHARVVDREGRKLILSVVRDLTERRRAEEELRNTLAHLEELVEARTAASQKANESMQGEMRERARAQDALLQNNRLLQAITVTQSQFIEDVDPKVLFAELLEQLIVITQSGCGFIGEVLHNPAGEPYIKTYALSNIAWNEATKRLYAEISSTGFEFTNLKTLFGAAITTGRPVIANDPATDLRRGGLPPGHPPLQSFLGLPLFSGGKLMGVVGLANRPDGYDHEVVEFLTPLLTTCGKIIEAFKFIKQRRTAEEALQRSEQDFRILVANIPAVVFMAYADGSVDFIDDKVEEMTGYTRDEFASRRLKWMEVVLPEDRRDVRKSFVQALKTSGAYVREYRIRSKAGTIRWVQERSRIITDPAGTVQFINGVIFDVTERKIAEEDLRDSEERFRQLAEHIREVFWIASADGQKILYISPAYEEIWGHPREELQNNPLGWIDAIHPDDRERVKDAFYVKSIQQGDKYDVEFRVIGPDGSLRWIHARGFNVCDATRKVCRIVGIAEDISSYKQAMEEIEQLSRQNRYILDSAGEGIYGVNLEGKATFINPAAAMMLGWDSADLLGQFQHALTHHTQPDGTPYPAGECQIYASMKDGQVRRVEDEVFWRKDGASFPVEYTSTPLKDEAGRVLGAMVVFRDVTERRQAEQEMRKLTTAVEQSLDWVVITDQRGAIEYVNQAVEEISGYPREELIGADTKILKSGKHDAAFYQELWSTIAAGNPYRAIFINRKKSGELFHLDMTIIPLRDAHGRITHYLSTAKDITQHIHMEERLNYLAYYDHLTGLPNRTLFNDRIRQALARSELNKRPTAVLALDLDRFQFINDTYGPDMGDAVLKQVAGMLTDAVREGDTVAHLGSDDFGIALLDLADPDDVVLMVERIKESIARTIKAQGEEVIVTASMGIAIYPHDGEDAGTLLKNAAIACSQVNDQGGNNYQFYAPGMNVKALEFVSLGKQLFNALKHEEFILHYQPYFQTTTEQMVGMEALIRWQSKDLGLVPPGKFIPVLEDTGLIRGVSEWTIRETCRQLKEWQRRGLAVVPVSVNFSPVQFRWPGLAEMMERVMTEYGLDPHLLIAEITESAIMQDVASTRTVLERFRDLGMAVSIDDFGTGHSSLSYLKRFPIDSLKIDISFIKDITTDPDAASIVTAIISMAHNLDLKTIAEGAENKEQVQILRLLRCDIIQGYYYSRPLPAAEVRKFLVRRKK